MSTLSQSNHEPAWKQEVNRRLAAHKNRKAADEPGTRPEAASALNSRAAEAAARVAARYAKAPSYSQLQAEEARVAVRQAEIATKVALEAQAAAHDAIAELHAASSESPSRGPAVVESIDRQGTAQAEIASAHVAVAEPAQTAQDVELEFDMNEPVDESLALDSAAGGYRTISLFEPEITPVAIPAAQAAQIVPDTASEPTPVQQVLDRETLQIRWEPDMPSRAIPMPPPVRQHEELELSAEDWWTPAQVDETLRNQPFAVDAQQVHANLIEFPRELVATRRMRPRHAEPAGQAVSEGQLSIFEVDPGSISTVAEAPAPAQEEPVVYARAEWTSLQLDAPAYPEPAQQNRAAAKEGKAELAPLSRRLLAVVVDAALILAVFLGGLFFMASRLQQLPAPKVLEIMAMAGLVLTGVAYQALFLLLGLSTPGMRYSGIALSTFEDELATPAQTRRRLGAMLLSLAPMGLGLVWAVFDEDHLSWHDRISGTYLRKEA